MPVVIRDGEFIFIIHTRELSYEPPHVHVRFGGQEVRIELNGGEFMEEPPPGRRREIAEVFRRHAKEIRSGWARIHERDDG